MYFTKGTTSLFILIRQKQNNSPLYNLTVIKSRARMIYIPIKKPAKLKTACRL